MADVPGIETLTMGFEAGRITLRWGAYAASVDAAASDGDVETAIRNAIKLPPVTMIPDKPAPAAVARPQTKVQPMSVTGASAAGQSLRELMEDNRRQLADLTAAHMDTMRAGFAKQLQGVQALGRLADKVHSEGDDFLALIGQYTNDLGYGE
ncbi:hypothetical protein [Bradyrhizobium sp. SZCCHNR2032]|uniref:hypothetical protein n=1 Tax=Bradyrhizobium sp. SZCCHNR2032 TaxID=3057384 RepID=UPI002915D239|nr:hypothetical protein [Bradyrhizobium sp. SZCCHNR2032]